jgi:hypothetical protein
MSSLAITTIVKMVESLPDVLYSILAGENIPQYQTRDTQKILKEIL